MLKTLLNSNLIIILLLPLSILFRAIIAIRNYLYDANRLKARTLPCKVISIGNITTGGSGKTPTVEFLSLYLKSLGKNVGIISRGYGRTSKNTKIVTDGINKPTSWESCGDEAFLLANKLDNIPIIVGKSKYDSGLKMATEFNTDVIIIDDGFQHRSLHRDLDIVLVNSKDTKKDHRPFPLGKLRENLSNLKRADLIIYTKSNIHNISDYLINTLNHIKINKIKSAIDIGDKLIDSNNKEATIDIIRSKNVFLLSGVGDNEGFKKTVEKAGCNILGHKKFIDHYNYKAKDIKTVHREAIKVDAKYLITTEKDIIKMKDFEFELPLYAIKMKLAFHPEDEMKNKIESLFN